MAKIKMEPGIMEGMAHRVWEEKCNINKLCSRQTKGDFVSYHHIGIVITCHVVPPVQLLPSCGDPTLNELGDPEHTML